MTTTSFTLRKTTVGYGSYVQNDGDDSALRSDQYVSLSAAVGAENTFTANIISQTSIELSWELSFSLSASAASAAPIALAIVASPTGEPITVKDGALVTKVTSNSISSFSDIVRVSEGRWVYYSLFVEYSDFGTPTPITWYERAASLYIQVPKQLNSLSNIWNRIPEYYRNLDYNQQGNPLYNFLELFGWEMDRTRTLIDTIALSNDPELAVTPALNELAKETGLEFELDVMGTTKTRAVLQNIGYIRRRKGTIESITSYLSAITGCQISYEEVSGDPFFKVHSQRINFIKDPKFTQALGTATNGTSPLRTKSVSSSSYGVYTYGASTTSAPTISTSGTALTVSVTGGTGNTTVVIYGESMPYYRPAYLYTGFEATLGVGASFTNFRLTDYTSGGTPSWESATAGASPSSPYYDTWNSTASLLPADPFNPSVTRVELAPNTTTEATANVLPTLVFTLAPGGSVTLTNWLVEPYALGEYFDGNTREGGLIPGSSGYGTGSSDYRWAGTANNSYSYYTLDYKRVYEVADDIVKNYLAPITIKDDITIVWDYYFGKT